MIIEKILNNNVVITRSPSGAETVIMGRGLAFGRAAGDRVDEKKIEKTFTITDPSLEGKLHELLAGMPVEHMLISEKIISRAKVILGKKLSDSIYLTLPDHISSTIARYEQGIVLENPLKWDIRRFYRTEYEIGMDANRLVEEETGVKFTDDEAAFIALHFVNAQQNSDIKSAYNMTYIMQEICQIVSDYFQMEFDEDSLDFYRFITHLKFFAQRMIHQTHYHDNMDGLLSAIAQQHPRAYDCATRIRDRMEQQYDFKMSPDEMLYLTIHISRLSAHKA
ncbi:BglG family transcription antiterminator LicT [Intestinibacillus sp. Marseille-P6563]|uniref:BglG family transcription antiterminator LicT n=1 Tax=Intestinibacillus sp. Marseille-P6563 TaxID=2364792 RepID=UPI000F0606A7|nr:PRD domain-containing protein [Intestinibacillus sp. Marseille-P6563]